MYQIGDCVECIADSTLKLTVGYVYCIESINDPFLRVRDDHGQSISFNKMQFKLASKFRPGDEITDGTVTAKISGAVYHPNKEYRFTILEDKSYPANAGTEMQLDMVSIDTLCKLVVPIEAVRFTGSGNLAVKEPVSELKPCTCDSLALFRNGCGCGAIVKRKWGL